MIKDWKKTKDNKYEKYFYNSKTSSKITLDTGMFFGDDTRFEVIRNNKSIVFKRFWKKSAALKFAKSYMKKH